MSNMSNTNNSNNTLHSSSGIIGEAQSGIRIRIGSTEEGSSTGTTRGVAEQLLLQQQQPLQTLLAPSVSCELGLGMTSGSSSEMAAAPKI